MSQRRAKRRPQGRPVRTALPVWFAVNDASGMAEFDGRTGLDILDWDECLALLGQCSLGRLAVVIDDQPLIFPVNFALDATAIVFRNDPGTKVYGARNKKVAFECDGTDPV
jgi:hypothetical protein